MKHLADVKQLVNKNCFFIPLLILIVILIASRAAHIRGLIDEPHSWRQSDTADYALDFCNNGIDLLRPSVNWMGNYKTVILEFPFPEALLAIAFILFGYHEALARLITLSFFAGSAAYLFAYC